jgi:hypothetical protein
VDLAEPQENAMWIKITTRSLERLESDMLGGDAVVVVVVES